MTRISPYIYRSLLTLLILAGAALARGQQTGINKIVSRTMLSPDGSSCTSVVDFYDGLGRPFQQAANGHDGTGRYVYEHGEYDCEGRDSLRWLPVVGSSVAEQLDTHRIKEMSQATHADGHAYSSYVYDGLGRLSRAYTAGDAWTVQGKHVSTEYLSNAAQQVFRYSAPVENTSLALDGYYPAHVLDVTLTTDEDGHQLEVFTDKQGRKVLERRNRKNDTYYVYNIYGQLRYVLTPEYQNYGKKALLAYEYRYDARGRMVKKLLPGCEYVQYWYDKADRLAYEQDARLRERGLYKFYLYDRNGRQVLAGTCSGCFRGDTINTARYVGPSAAALAGYALDSPGLIDNPDVTTASYYDSYAFIDYISGIFPQEAHLLQSSKTYHPAGRLTGQYMVASDGSPLLSVLYHDMRGNVIDEKSLALGRMESNSRTYTFTDKLAQQQTTVVRTGSNGTACELTAITTNTYCAVSDKPYQSSLLAFSGTPITTQPGTQLIKETSYDGLGRIHTERRAGNAGTRTWLYNIHGWPVSIEDPWFAESLHYTDGVGTPLFSGLLSSMTWTATNEGVTRGYKFAYDGLGRLTSAVYGEGAGLGDKANRYDEVILRYNDNGAPERLQRRGLKTDGVYGKIDNLNIELNGNQLLSVTDDAEPVVRYGAFDFLDGASLDSEYSYDGCGALTRDANKGIANILYDIHGNPREVLFYNGCVTRYVYAPNGTRLRAMHGVSPLGILQRPGEMEPVVAPINVVFTDTTDYVGSAIFRNGKLERYNYDGGYCTFLSDGTAQMHYYSTDHLGNNRAVVSSDGLLEQVTHYYPFGAVYADAGLNADRQPYKLCGKELERMHGLDLYDFGARSYDALLVQWTGFDQLGENYYSMSPYTYCANNPLVIVDEDGKKIRIKSGNNRKFHEGFKASLILLKENKMDGLLAKLEKLPQTIYITALDSEKRNGGPEFNVRENTIYWDPGLGLRTNNNNVLSPATLLNHEAYHAYRANTARIDFDKKRYTKDPSYNNKEEKITIEGIEQRTAKALGEIKGGEKTRNDHKGSFTEYISIEIIKEKDDEQKKKKRR